MLQEFEIRRFSLDQLEVGTSALVVAIDGRGALARRMMEMGLVPGAPVRVIPADAMMARMEIVRSTDTDPMRAKLDGKAFGLAPGLRIFSTETLLMNPVTVAGKKFPVRYKLDLYGQLLTAWVMTDAEVKAWKAAH